jgi:3-phenylpropionate/cinnamic acid dioxygenase small subunit
MTEGSAQELHQDIEVVLVRYATAIDRKDWALFRTCFTEDCDADYGAIGTWHGVEAIAGWMAEVHDACGHTLHRITNVVVARDGEGATARSYVDVLVFGPDDLNGVHAAGFYDDGLVETDDGWRIADRRFTSVLQEPVTSSG